MQLKYFSNLTNIDDLKTVYRELTKKHHPDICGNDGMAMKTINLEYAYIRKNGIKNNKGENENKPYDLFARLIEQINVDLQSLHNLRSKIDKSFGTGRERGYVHHSRFEPIRRIESEIKKTYFNLRQLYENLEKEGHL